ncbi:YeiH family protein [Paenibacillus sedimenti]|uniref:YeiH family putative sulfate export transporter n=1 Tax=Paenibacillus sedimenti TaxID=2770274 RepID=A0A926KTH0_9BACL|nr:YeiH family protein [Paenibacillus sedimenti]MBD0383013.1 YeiH family putative sulfate export transporter [Paenibacillus sedimenti]
MAQAKAIPYSTKQTGFGFAKGIGLTLGLALIAKGLSGLPILSIIGQLVIAIMLGIGWKAAVGVSDHTFAGASFASKKLLRLGIILLGMRLNMADVIQAGPHLLLLAILQIAFAISVVYGLSRLFNVERRLGMLTACGTAICGAAAIVAISPQMRASDEETAISAASVAILGTIFTLIYTIIYPYLRLTAEGYGIWAGGTLHEVAHVIAAAAPVSREAEDMAVMVKLSRVAMLVPIAVLIGIWTRRLEKKKNRNEPIPRNWKRIPVPWFILGFIVMCGVNTSGILSKELTNDLIVVAYFLITMAMTGLGLSVNIAAFRKFGIKSFAAGLIGSILLSIFGYGIVVFNG